MIHLTSTLVEGYAELLSFCECTRRLAAKQLLEEFQSNEILLSIAEEMTYYESLFTLLKIETPKTDKNLSETQLRRFTETYSPEVIEQGYYDALVNVIIFNQ